MAPVLSLDKIKADKEARKAKTKFEQKLDDIKSGKRITPPAGPIPRDVTDMTNIIPDDPVDEQDIHPKSNKNQLDLDGDKEQIFDNKSELEADKETKTTELKDSDVEKIKENATKAEDAMNKTASDLRTAAEAETDAAKKAQLLSKADEAEKAVKSASKFGKFLEAANKNPVWKTTKWFGKVAGALAIPAEVAFRGVKNANWEELGGENVSKLGTLKATGDIIEKGIWGTLYGAADTAGALMDYGQAFVQDIALTPAERKAQGSEWDRASERAKDRSDMLDNSLAETYANIDQKFYGKGDKTKYLKDWGVETILPEDQDAEDANTTSTIKSESDKYDKAYQERTKDGSTKVVLKNGNVVHKYKPDEFNPKGYQVVIDKNGDIVVDTNASKVNKQWRGNINSNALTKEDMFTGLDKNGPVPNLFSARVSPDNKTQKNAAPNPFQSFEDDAAKKKKDQANKEIKSQNDYNKAVKVDQEKRNAWKDITSLFD